MGYTVAPNSVMSRLMSFFVHPLAQMKEYEFALRQIKSARWRGIESIQWRP